MSAERRRSRSALLWTLLFPLCAALPARAADVAPAGYSWRTCTGMGAEVLVPDGWHFRDAPGDRADACSFSLDPPSAEGKFETGVSLSLLRQVPERTGQTPSDFARGFLDKLAERYRLRRRSSSSQPPFEAFRAEVDLEDERGKPLRLYQLAIANPMSGSVYLVAFRAPAARYEAEWKRVERALERLGLDLGV